MIGGLVKSKKEEKSMEALASLCNACLLGNFEGENRMYA
jgi:hypothetical protein